MSPSGYPQGRVEKGERERGRGEEQRHEVQGRSGNVFLSLVFLLFIRSFIHSH